MTCMIFAVVRVDFDPPDVGASYLCLEAIAMQTAVFSSTNHRRLVWHVHLPVLHEFPNLCYV